MHWFCHNTVCMRTSQLVADPCGGANLGIHIMGRDPAVATHQGSNLYGSDARGKADPIPCAQPNPVWWAIRAPSPFNPTLFWTMFLCTDAILSLMSSVCNRCVPWVWKHRHRMFTLRAVASSCRQGLYSARIWLNLYCEACLPRAVPTPSHPYRAPPPIAPPCSSALVLPVEALCRIVDMGGGPAFMVLATACASVLSGLLEHHRARWMEQAVCPDCQAIFYIWEGSHCDHCHRRLLSNLYWPQWSVTQRQRFVGYCLRALKLHPENGPTSDDEIEV